MVTLNDNYKKNIAILKENIKRGLTMEQAQKVIDGMKLQFINANLYDDEAKMFIEVMQDVIKDNFTTTIKATDVMKSLGIEIVRIK